MGYSIFSLNSGSSSIKFSLYNMETSEELELSGAIEGIGLEKGRFFIRDKAGKSLIDQIEPLKGHDQALTTLFGWLREQPYGEKIDAIGHRVVHGGPALREHQLLSANLLAELYRLSPFIPNHLPHEIKGIEAAKRFYSEAYQMICFDTAFHRAMPDQAKMYALPRRFYDQGIIRYGFHGLSYEYIMQELKKATGNSEAEEKLIIAHLGQGSSMVAIKQDEVQDTTMGFTPTEGLVMGTRTGDLDPGIILYLLQAKEMNANAINQLINHESGVLGVSGISSDMKTLLAQAPKEPRAAEAINLFCYRVRKYFGALTATLGGLDSVIFTGGIGENSPAIRWRICQDLEFLGIRLDQHSNKRNAPIISNKESRIIVRVLPTNEELMIARHTYQFIRKEKIYHEK